MHYHWNISLLYYFIYFVSVTLSKKNDFFTFIKEAAQLRDTIQQQSTNQNQRNQNQDENNQNLLSPIILIPGLVASRMIAWKRKDCLGPDIEIQDIVWLNLQKLIETLTYDKRCWLDCLKLDINSTDPIDCKLRPEEGLSAVSELSPGSLYTPAATSVFTKWIKMFVNEFGYDSNSMIGAPYDWRLSPFELERRDSYFTKLKLNIETIVKKLSKPSIIIAHSLGNNLFLYFCDWMYLQFQKEYSNDAIEALIKYEDWIDQHISTYIGIAAPLLGAPGALKSVMSGHTFGLPISELRARELLLTFPSTSYLNPRDSTAFPSRKKKKKQQNQDKRSKSQYEPLDYQFPMLTVKPFPSSSPSSSKADNTTTINSSNFEESVEDQSENKTINITVQQIADGSFFKIMGDLYNDSLISNKYDSLKSLYHEDPVQPLADFLDRPPIQNVIMVYGVDLPTEIGYTYRFPDKPATEIGPVVPVLEEIFVEETIVKHALKRVPSLKDSYDNSRRTDQDNSGKPADPLSSTPSTVEEEVLSLQQLAQEKSPTANHHEEGKEEGNQNMKDINNLFREIGKFTNLFKNLLNNKQTPIVEEEIQQDLPSMFGENEEGYSENFLVDEELVTNSEDELAKTKKSLHHTILDESSTSSLTSPNNYKFIPFDIENPIDNQPPTSDAMEIKESPEIIAEAKLPKKLSDLIHVNHSQLFPSQSGIFMIKPKTGLFVLNSKTLHSINHHYDHSGDMTVPYISLSYAKSWLLPMSSSSLLWEQELCSVVEEENNTCQAEEEDDEKAIPVHSTVKTLFIPSSSTILAFNYSTPASNGSSESSNESLDILFEWAMQQNQATFPSVELFHSEDPPNDLSKTTKPARTTLIMEVSGGEHLEVLQQPFLHYLIFQYLLPRL